MPAHSFLISLAQGLPACCARATELESSSAVIITSPDRIPAILVSSVRWMNGHWRLDHAETLRQSAIPSHAMHLDVGGNGRALRTDRDQRPIRRPAKPRLPSPLSE